MVRVKLCPSCDRENPPTAPFCACGASLATVPKVEARPHQPPPVETTTASTPSEPPVAGIICPESSCGAVNPPGSPHCLFCNTSLSTASTDPVPTITLRWPWGEQALLDTLPIGRDPDFSPLAERLDAYDNISRRHAELRRDGSAVWIEDLGSTNGTFVDEQRLVPHQPRRMEGNFTIRLARDLKATIETREQK
ncbi:FHA domain-containing protein [Gammaproteobacteria bacterium]